MIEELTLWCAFPKLAPPKKFRITSPKTKSHNCIAYAADDQTRKWWPDKMEVDHWPDGVIREPTIEAFVAAFQTLGYEVFDSPDPEANFEKIALYTKPSGTPTHASKQWNNGLWRSKLGDEQDVEHELDGLDGIRYGAITKFMRRPIKAT